MNRENITKVRDVIAGLPPERFAMRTYIGVDGLDSSRVTPAAGIKECNSAACAAGWTMVTLKPRSRASHHDYDAIAGGLLGIDEDGADELFRPEGWLHDEFTPAHAVRVLDHLLATGEVDWKSTRRAKKAVQS